MFIFSLEEPWCPAPQEILPHMTIATDILLDCQHLENRAESFSFLCFPPKYLLPFPQSIITLQRKPNEMGGGEEVGAAVGKASLSTHVSMSMWSPKVTKKEKQLVAIKLFKTDNEEDMREHG